MNENTSFERSVAEAFEREGRGRPVPDALHDELLSDAGSTRQLPTWLASIKEPPMRLSNSLAVGSPTVRVAAVMAATLLLAVLLAGAGIAGQRLLAASADHIVDADGGGDFTTIAEAVAVAQDGESILVKNGTYTESVVITEDISVTGESRDGVVIEFGAGCALEGEGELWEKQLVCEPGVQQLEGGGFDFYRAGPFALHLSDSGASLSDLTFRHLSTGFGIYVTGGAPTISRVTYADSIREDPSGGNNLMLRGGTRAKVTDTDIGVGAAFVVDDQSPVIVMDSNAGAMFSSAPPTVARGGHAVVSNNTLGGMILAEGLHEIRDNVIELTDSPWEQPGIALDTAAAGWIVEGNTIRGSTAAGAIDIGTQAGPGVVADNVLEGNTVGILVAAMEDVEVRGNTVSDGGIGLQITRGVSEVRDNTVEGMSDIGINIQSGGTLVSGNVACGNGTDLMVSASSDSVVDDTNEFCVVVDPREG